jgi:hypothetical protein
MDLLPATGERETFLSSAHMFRTHREKTPWKTPWSCWILSGITTLVFGTIFLQLQFSYLLNDRSCAAQLSSYCKYRIFLYDFNV